MKVIHRTETLLVLEDQPWLIGVLMIVMSLCFIAGGMALMGEGKVIAGASLTIFGGGIPLLIAALMVRRVRLSLDRSSGQITRIERSVGGLKQTTYALDRLQEVKVGVNYDSDGNTYRTELRLTGPEETLPFTSYYTSGKKPEAMAQAVNDWLTAPR